MHENKRTGRDPKKTKHLVTNDKNIKTLSCDAFKFGS